MNPQDFPDLTLSEIKESDEYDTEDLGIEDEIDEREAATLDAVVILCAEVALANMVEDDYITLREYVRLGEYLVEWNRDLDESPL